MRVSVAFAFAQAAFRLDFRYRTHFRTIYTATEPLPHAPLAFLNWLVTNGLR